MSNGSPSELFSYKDTGKIHALTLHYNFVLFCFSFCVFNCLQSIIAIAVSSGLLPSFQMLFSFNLSHFYVHFNFVLCLPTESPQSRSNDQFPMIKFKLTTHRNKQSRGYSHILTIRVCATVKGMVFRPSLLTFRRKD